MYFDKFHIKFLVFILFSFLLHFLLVYFFLGNKSNAKDIKPFIQRDISNINLETILKKKEVKKIVKKTSQIKKKIEVNKNTTKKNITKKIKINKATPKTKPTLNNKLNSDNQSKELSPTPAKTLQSYKNKVLNIISKNKKYSSKAKRLKLTGRGIVKIIIDRNGNLLNYNLIQSSGSSILDSDIIDLINKSAPFPRFKDSIKENTLEYNIPISYKLY